MLVRVFNNLLTAVGFSVIGRHLSDGSGAPMNMPGIRRQRHWQRHRRHLHRRAAVILGGLALAVAALLPAVASAATGSGGTTGATTAAATTDTSPVNLSTPVDMAAGKAQQRATVVAGDARFEVLAPDVIRLEYSPTASFLDQPTFSVLDRDFSAPPYTTTRSGGWLTIRTSGMVLRYKLGSGPFSPGNTQMSLLGRAADGTSAVQPSWEWECTFGQVCQSGSARLGGGAALASDHTGYVSPAGFVASYSHPGDDATWQVLGAPAGQATVTIRYANYIGAIGGPAPRTMTLDVNGASTRLTLPPTSSWNDWATITEPVTLQSGTNEVAVDCATGDDCNVNVDDISVTTPGATATPVVPAGALGGYIRSFDSANGTYTSTPSCGDASHRASGTAGSGTPRCSPTRRPSCPGPSRRTCTSHSTFTPASPSPTRSTRWRSRSPATR
jgi:hypothetical protein